MPLEVKGKPLMFILPEVTHCYYQGQQLNGYHIANLGVITI